MSRTIAGLAALALLVTSSAVAQTNAEGTAPGGAKAAAAETKSMAGAKPMTVTGEIVELGCYLGHGAKGAEHRSCAVKSISDGAPIGVLTGDGKLYLLTANPSNSEALRKARSMPAETVKVSGPVLGRDGLQSIQVKSVEVASGAKPADASKAG